MRIKGIGWLGTRTERFDEMVKFATDALGLHPQKLRPGFAVFALPDGDLFEVFGPANPENAFMTGPMGEFLVDDVEGARAEMEAKGVEFIAPTQRTQDGKIVWAHFRAPDGHVYGITSRSGAGQTPVR